LLPSIIDPLTTWGRPGLIMWAETSTGEQRAINKYSVKIITT